MEITIIKQTKISNMIRHLLHFVVLIGFSFSTIKKKNVNLICERENILEEIIYLSDSIVLEDADCFIYVRSMIEDDKNGIIEKKSLEHFDQSLIYIFVKKIEYFIDNKNYENISIKEKNEILDIFIENISEISELNIYNNTFFNETIIKLLFIYSNNEKNDLNFKNFNKKIIPIIKKILSREIIEYKNNINYSFIKKCINIFKLLVKNESFFLNLDKNIKLKKLFINLIDKHISFLIIENNFYDISIFIQDYFHKLVLEFIENNNSCKKVFLKFVDFFFKRFKEIPNLDNITSLNFNDPKSIIFDLTTYLNFDNIKSFLNKLFQNISFVENINDLDTLINIFNNIADVEIYLNTKKVDRLYIYTIEFYIEYIATISEENKEKNSKLVRIFEENINKFITLIKSFKIDETNLMFNNYSYGGIKNYLYYSYINFENDKFSNTELAKNIIDTLKNYIKKIAIFEYIRIGFDETKINENSIISPFLYNNINLKNEIIEIVFKQLEQLSSKTSEKKELSEEFFFTIINKKSFYKCI